MARVTFINLFKTLDDALSVKSSPSIDSSFHTLNGIQLIPNNEYPYIQSTNDPDGIELEDWEVYVVDVCKGTETEITDSFFVERVFTDDDGMAQFEWSLTNIPYDFGYDFIYLKVVQQVGQTFYSNPFQITAKNTEETTRVDYKDSDNETMLSTQLKMWFWQELKSQEIGSYYETSTRNTVTTIIKSQRFENWETAVIDNWLMMNISDLFEYKYTYLDLTRCNLFEAIEIKEHQGTEAYARNIIKLTFNSNDTFNPIVKEDVIPVPPPSQQNPDIVLNDVLNRNGAATYFFRYENFLPQSLVFEYSQDQITWTKETAGITNPQSIPFNFTSDGVWYYRISHQFATSNILTKNHTGTILARPDTVKMIKGKTIIVDVLANDDQDIPATITSAGSTDGFGIATVVQNGTRVQYKHNSGNEDYNEVNYYVSNGVQNGVSYIRIFVYDYSAVLVTHLGSSLQENSCAIDFNSTRVKALYYDGSGTPVVGNKIYEAPNIDGVDIPIDVPYTGVITEFNGNNLWYQISGGKAIKIDTNGNVTQVAFC